MEFIWILVFFLATGAVAGFLAGLLGVGGGIVLVPAFFYGFTVLGYASDGLMQICIATSIATIVVTSIRSVLTHHKKGAVDWKILRQWSPWIAMGAGVGVFVAAGLSSNVLQIIFGLLGLCVGAYMAFGREEWVLSDQMPARLGQSTIGSFIGFLSVLMGIGGGSFGVPLMTLHRIPIHNAVATAAGFGLVIAVPSALGWLFIATPEIAPPLTLGAINVVAFAIIIPMTILMAPYGAAAAHRLAGLRLRRVFSTFLLFVAANMIVSAFWS